MNGWRGRRPVLLPLLVMAAGALFPFGWLGQRWPAFDDWLALVFASEFAHAAGHAAIFLGLGLAVLAAWPALRQQPGRYTALLLAAAIGQELFQLLYKARPAGADELRDLAVDALAIAAAFVLARIVARPEVPR